MVFFAELTTEHEKGIVGVAASGMCSPWDAWRASLPGVCGLVACGEGRERIPREPADFSRVGACLPVLACEPIAGDEVCQSSVFALPTADRGVA